MWVVGYRNTIYSCAKSSHAMWNNGRVSINRTHVQGYRVCMQMLANLDDGNLTLRRKVRVSHY